MLEFADEAKSLFFTTTLHNAVQSYSLRESRLLDQGQAHPSPPTVLAMSPTSHLLLSASEDPVTIYLQNLTLRTPPLLIKPSASAAPVVTASFHPERPNVFLLAFSDGVAAAYDATRLLRSDDKISPRVTPKPGQDGEIAHFKNLHTTIQFGAREQRAIFDRDALGRYGGNRRTVTAGKRSMGIEGAAFVPGYKTRAVTVGDDGKCRFLDFAEGGKVLRTWHIKGPATSLSVLALKEDMIPLSATYRPTTASRGKPLSGQRSVIAGSGANCIVAIGRIDGKVLLFDLLGLQLAERTVDPEAGKVINVEWVGGPAPKPVTGPESVRFSEETIIDLPMLEDGTNSIGSPPKRCKKGTNASSTAQKTDGRPTSTPSERSGAMSPLPQTPSKYLATVENEGTVKHTTINGPVHRDFPPVSGASYMDIFSPVKTSLMKASPMRASPEQRNSRLGPRPRLLSSTFMDNKSPIKPPSPVKSPVRRLPTTALPKPSPLRSASPSRVTPPSRATSAAKPESPNPNKLRQSYLSLKPLRPPSPEKHISKSPLRPPSHAVKKRRVSQVRMPGAYIDSKTSLLTASSASNASLNSGKILADLRRVSNASARSSKSSSTGSLAFLAPYINPGMQGSTSGRAKSRSSRGRLSSIYLPAPAEEKGKRFRRSKVATLDSTESDDIWMTSGSEDEGSSNHARSRQKGSEAHSSSRDSEPNPRSRHCPATRPPLRSSEGGDATAATTATAHPAIAPFLPPGSAQSPQGPVDVEHYFPRTSSRQHPESPSASGGQAHPARAARASLGEVSGNAGRPGAGGPAVEKGAAALGSPARRGGLAGLLRERERGCRCGSACCAELRREMKGMGEELGRLREEVMAMRVVRR